MDGASTHFNCCPNEYHYHCHHCNDDQKYCDTGTFLLLILPFYTTLVICSMCLLCGLHWLKVLRRRKFPASCCCCCCFCCCCCRLKMRKEKSSGAGAAANLELDYIMMRLRYFWSCPTIFFFFFPLDTINLLS